jgi:cell division inhibitor SepF
MGGALRKTMVYLGLAEDDERYDAYDVDDDFPDDEPTHDEDRERVPARGQADTPVEPAAGGREGLHAEDRRDDRRAAVTPINRGQMARMVQPAPVRSELHRISTIHPRTYNEAKTIGEAFRSGTPVIMNLGDLDDSDAKRLVDFAAGLVFGLHGAIERVTSKVFLLSPAGVEVAPAEKVKTPERTFFNQS